MNERYKELEKQCTKQQIDYDVGKMDDQVDHRKLAELIVRECALVVFKKTGPKSALDVLEHFGVEE